MTVTPGTNPLTSGTVVTITYTGGTPGDKIKVDMDDGGIPTPKTDSVEITLDANGEGTATWTVPTWDLVNFNAPGVGEISRQIVPPVM